MIDVRVPDLLLYLNEPEDHHGLGMPTMTERSVRFSASSPKYLVIQVDEDVNGGMVPLRQASAQRLMDALRPAGEVRILGDDIGRKANGLPLHGQASVMLGGAVLRLPLPDSNERLTVPDHEHEQIHAWLHAVLTGEHEYTGADGEEWSAY